MIEPPTDCELAYAHKFWLAGTRSPGSKGRTVFNTLTLVLIESTIVAAIGFLVGGGLGYGGLVYLSRHGWDISMLSDMAGSIGLPRVIYASTSGWYWVAALSVVVVTALAAAWYPARRVNRLEPVTAIREG